MEKSNFKWRSTAVSLDSIKKANDYMVHVKAPSKFVEDLQAVTSIAETFVAAERVGKLLISATHYGRTYQKCISTEEMNDAYSKSLATICQEIK